MIKALYNCTGLSLSKKVASGGLFWYNENG